MGFVVEQKCPQCGAPIEFKETDRLIRCPYCNVENYLFAPGHFRFVLPHKASGKEIIYAPRIFALREMCISVRAKLLATVSWT